MWGMLGGRRFRGTWLCFCFFLGGGWGGGGLRVVRWWMDGEMGDGGVGGARQFWRVLMDPGRVSVLVLGF